MQEVESANMNRRTPAFSPRIVFGTGTGQAVTSSDALKTGPTYPLPASETFWNRYLILLIVTVAVHFGNALSMLIILHTKSSDWGINLCSSYTSWVSSLPGVQCFSTVDGVTNVCRQTVVYNKVGQLRPGMMSVMFSFLSFMFQVSFVFIFYKHC